MIRKKKLEKQYSQCCVCDWSEWTIDLCHIIPDIKGGTYCFDNIVPLCPNHHRLLDNNALRMFEMELIPIFIHHIYERLSHLDHLE